MLSNMVWKLAFHLTQNTWADSEGVGAGKSHVAIGFHRNSGTDPHPWKITSGYRFP